MAPPGGSIRPPGWGWNGGRWNRWRGWNGGWWGGGWYPYAYPVPYPYPYPYPYPVYVLPDEETSQSFYTEQPPEDIHWWYCRNPPGYYPDVVQCPDDWVAVTPGTPPPPPTEPPR